MIGSGDVRVDYAESWRHCRRVFVPMASASASLQPSDSLGRCPLDSDRRGVALLGHPHVCSHRSERDPSVRRRVQIHICRRGPTSQLRPFPLIAGAYTRAGTVLTTSAAPRTDPPSRFAGTNGRFIVHQPQEAGTPRGRGGTSTSVAIGALADGRHSHSINSARRNLRN